MVDPPPVYNVEEHDEAMSDDSADEFERQQRLEDGVVDDEDDVEVEQQQAQSHVSYPFLDAVDIDPAHDDNDVAELPPAYANVQQPPLPQPQPQPAPQPAPPIYDPEALINAPAPPQHEPRAPVVAPAANDVALPSYRQAIAE
jgi:hypothetical protein